MTLSGSSRSIVIAAVKWAELRRWALLLRERRRNCYCENCKIMTDGHHVAIGEKGTPCWKTWVQDDADRWDAERPPQSEWCESCLRREKIHLAYQRIVRRRGAALREVIRLCKPTANAPEATGGPYA